MALTLFSTPDNEVYKNRFLEDWGNLTSLRKPVIAAVSGYAVRHLCFAHSLSAPFADNRAAHSSVAAASSP